MSFNAIGIDYNYSPTTIYAWVTVIVMDAALDSLVALLWLRRPEAIPEAITRQLKSTAPRAGPCFKAIQAAQDEPPVLLIACCCASWTVS